MERSSNTPRTRAAHGETRERVLDAAQLLLQTESYDGFSFRDVAEAVGIRKASVYHHFESKEALAAAVADRAAERFRDWASWQTARPPLERLAAYCFELYGEHLGAGHRLCPGGALISGWSHLSADVHRSVESLLNLHLEFLRRAITDGAAAGELRLPAGGDADATARWFVASVQGALVLSRAADSYESFRELCQTTLGCLASGSD